MKYISTIVFIILFTGCFSYDQKDFDFNESELKHLSSYKTGDTIYFENQVGDLDTIVVKGFEKNQKKEFGTFMALPASNYIGISIQHIPTDKWQGTIQNGNEPIRITYQNIFTMSKFPQTKQIHYSISFKNFCSNGYDSIGEFSNDTLRINQKKITNYYVPKNEYPERVVYPYDIEIVYWTDNDGLTAYKYKNGLWYTKKQLLTSHLPKATQ